MPKLSGCQFSIHLSCGPINGIKLSEYRLIDGFATPSGTSKFAKQSVAMGNSPSNFREAQGLSLSSIGMGTYLGNLTREDDLAIENGIFQSISSGAMNVIDTALNYRAMRSEKSIGRAMRRLADAGIGRDQFFVCTKNGYITNDGDYPAVDVMEYIHKMFIANGVISASDISSGYNVMNPNYISRCIDKSLSNLHLSTIDLVYIHNAFESWSHDVDGPTFFEMLFKVFQVYESYRKSGKIRYYGMATWTCFRSEINSDDHLSLEHVVRIAERAGGTDHGFKFIQMPYNLAYFEANSLQNQKITGIETLLTPLVAASKLGIGVFASAPLLQGNLLRANLPDFEGAPRDSNIAKAIQVVRSSPGIVSALIGQKNPKHVNENVKLASIPVLDPSQLHEAIAKLEITK